jgi:hypothetical protein
LIVSAVSPHLPSARTRRTLLGSVPFEAKLAVNAFR